MQRVKSGKAAVKLRKLFLYRGSPFNVMQEVWIQDKHNPDAQGPHGDPLKEFAVVHVHHHAGVRRLQDVDENTAETRSKYTQKIGRAACAGRQIFQQSLPAGAGVAHPARELGRALPGTGKGTNTSTRAWLKF